MAAIKGIQRMGGESLGMKQRRGFLYYFLSLLGWFLLCKYDE